MTNAEILSTRFREVILNGTLIANTNYKNELEKLDWKIAVEKFNTLNSIAILAQHIHYYLVGVKDVFKGGTLDIKDKYSFDFTPIESQKEWKAFLAKFWDDAEEFALLIEQMSEDKLKEIFVDEKYGTYHDNINVMIEHCYYHLGQIVLIKKILLGQSNAI